MIGEAATSTATTPRRERLRAMMHEDILAAARTIVRTTGIKELSMRALAKEVGVTAPTLYDYFPSKDALLDALYLEAVHGLYAEFDHAAALPVSCGQRLLQVAHAYRDFARAQSDLFLLVFGRVDATRRPDIELREQCKRLMDPVERIVSEAAENGELRSGTPWMIGHLLWATVHGFVMLELNGVMGDDVPCEALDHLFNDSLQVLRDCLMPTAQETPAPAN